mgnify:CR=1 FL=1
MILAKLPNRTDYVDAVYRALRDAISDGTLAPGARITQEDLAAQFNVSRSPVLQALRLLKKDGLLEDAPGRGLLREGYAADLLLQAIAGVLFPGGKGLTVTARPITVTTAAQTRVYGAANPATAGASARSVQLAPTSSKDATFP